jgi:hypothetical protein
MRRAVSSPRRYGGDPYSVILLDEIEKGHPDVLNPAPGPRGRGTAGYSDTGFLRNCILV